MTPQQQFDYKLKWRTNAFSVRLHSDLDWKGKDWCRKHLERHQWGFNKWTAVYEHTFIFEHQKDANAFKEAFIEYADQEPLDCGTFQKLEIKR